ncbi:hypothetical protein ACA910_002994 [Epithemia clementina (nom. ined.)]
MSTAHGGSAVPQFTYELGKSLYVPFTSLSGNALSLPATRGPKFTLPAHVVAALCRVRDAEQESLFQWRTKISGDKESEPSISHPPVKWEAWCRWLDTQDGYFPLPPPQGGKGNQTSTPQEKQQQEETDMSLRMSHLQAADSGGHLRPTVGELVRETLQQIHDSNNNNYNDSGSRGFEAIVLAGEGEPLLRPKSVLDFLVSLQSQPANNRIPIRLVTSGLFPKADAPIQDLASRLHQAGLDRISIALQTHDPADYNHACLKWHHDLDSSGAATPRYHDQVCDFIRTCVQSGLHTETTAVERPDVDRDATEALSQALGVTTPIRWRSYYS